MVISLFENRISETTHVFSKVDIPTSNALSCLSLPDGQDNFAKH